MKTKKEYISFWIEQAEDDWSVVELLYKGRKFLQSLFFAHLVIEKICKSLWIKHNEKNIPPKTHNLIYLLSQTSIELSEEQSEFMLSLNRFQLEGRYPEYITKLQNICDEDFTTATLETTKKIRVWLLEKVQ